MSALDVLILLSVLFLPPIACRSGYRRGVADAKANFKKAEVVRLRYCQCGGVQKPTN